MNEHLDPWASASPEARAVLSLVDSAHGVSQSMKLYDRMLLATAFMGFASSTIKRCGVQANALEEQWSKSLTDNSSLRKEVERLNTENAELRASPLMAVTAEQPPSNEPPDWRKEDGGIGTGGKAEDFKI
jgi:hypothetical protein